MTQNEQRLLGELMTKLDGVRGTVDELKGDVKAIRTACPTCTGSLAVHSSKLDSLENELNKKASAERMQQVECQVGAIWNRLWAVALGVAGLVSGVAYLIRHF